MMGVARLYPDVARRRKMFEGVKRLTVPGQCMSLAEMFRRFVRREPLPSEKRGMYYEGEFDLEKVAKMDRVEQDEILEELKEKNAGRKAKAEAAIKKAEEAAASAPVVDPVVSVSSSADRPGGPVLTSTPKV